MILIVAASYPSCDNIYTNGFIHSRVKNYISHGILCKVFILTSSRQNKKQNYCFEGVEVVFGTRKELIELVNNEKQITTVCFHFLTVNMLRSLKEFRADVRAFIFVHGNEALWWYERIFPETFGNVIQIVKFIKYIIVNSFSILFIRNNLQYVRADVHLVFVSQWMKKITMSNWKLDKKNYMMHIIPNVVDEKVFQFNEKDASVRYNLLLIRSFTSGKYALDIAMDIINELEKYPEAEKMRITIYGDGWLYDKYTSMIKHYDNVECHRCFLTHSEIVKEHAKNGFFLCPTRQDAQGVSMCEAMSSGLIPISSINSAIPEYLPEEYHLAFINSKDAAARIIEIMRDEEMYIKMSHDVSKYIQGKCSTTQTVDKEVELMQED